MGRGYAAHGMSARRLSMERRTTLPSAGGDVGTATPASCARAVADIAGAASGIAPVAEGPAVVDASGCGCAEAGCAGGESLEHAAEHAAATRATAMKVGARVMWARAGQHEDYESTVICNFSRRARYSLLML